MPRTEQIHAGRSDLKSESTDDHFLMEGLPVVEVVEVDGVEDFTFVRDSAGAEDAGADSISVVVAGDGGVQFGDRGGIQRATGLGEHPGFELWIRGLGGDEAFKCRFVQAKAVEDHLVVALAARRIVGMKFASRAERGFEPEAWQMEDAERTGGAGADHGDDVGHGFVGWEVTGTALGEIPMRSRHRFMGWHRAIAIPCFGGNQESADFSRFIRARSVSNPRAAALCGNFIPSSHCHVERPLLKRYLLARPTIRRIHFV